MVATAGRRHPRPLAEGHHRTLDSAREQLMSAAGSSGYVTLGIHRTASLSTSGPKGAYVVLCEYAPSPSDDMKELI